MYREPAKDYATCTKEYEKKRQVLTKFKASIAEHIWCRHVPIKEISFWGGGIFPGFELKRTNANLDVSQCKQAF